MPWIPYTDDNYVMAGIGVLWALGFVIWGLNARKRRRPAGAYIRGLVLAAVGLVACLIFYTGYILARQASENAQAALSQKYLILLGVGLLQYAGDHNNHLPPANAWATDIEPYAGKDPEIFHGPGAHSPYSYAFNEALGGLSLNSIAKPADTVAIFECDAKTLNTSGSAADFVTTRHVGKGYALLADGSVRGVKSATDLNWKP